VRATSIIVSLIASSIAHRTARSAPRTTRARHLKCAFVITYSLTRRYPSPRSGSCAAFCPSAPRSRSSLAGLAWRGCTASRTSRASSAVTAPSALNEFEGRPRVRAKWARARASPRCVVEGVARAKVTRKVFLDALTSLRASRDDVCGRARVGRVRAQISNCRAERAKRTARNSDI
jgi:hypothetical protein